MSDCSTNANGPYDVARLRIEFQDGEVPWMYPLALNGRVIKGMFVNDEQVEHVRECVPVWNGKWLCCGSCGECLGRFGVRTMHMIDGTKVRTFGEKPNYCPNCGAKVVSA